MSRLNSLIESRKGPAVTKVSASMSEAQRDQLDAYCKRRGISRNEFVSAATLDALDAGLAAEAESNGGDQVDEADAETETETAAAAE